MQDHIRSNKYWRLHKEVWYDRLNRLDSKIQKRIFSNPHCHAGKKLGSETHKEVATILTANFKPNKN